MKMLQFQNKENRLEKLNIIAAHDNVEGEEVRN